MQDPHNFLDGGTVSGSTLPAAAKHTTPLDTPLQEEVGPNPGKQSVQNPLPLEWLLQPRKDGGVVDRALARLIQLEAHAETIPEKECYRQSFITLSLAAKGSPIPFVEASYLMYGIHPDKLWPALVERRKAQLGSDYSKFYDADGNRLLDSSSPKKPAQSTTANLQRKDGPSDVA